MNAKDRLLALERSQARPPGLTWLMLIDRGNGTYEHRGSGKVYSEEEVQRMGDGVLIITQRVVRKADE